MNIEKKILRLLEHGFNTSTLADLKPNQIDALYQRLSETKKEAKEGVTTQTLPPQKITTVDQATAKKEMIPVKNGVAGIDASGNLVVKGALNQGKEENDNDEVINDSEVKEDDNLDLYSDPDASADGMGMFEENLEEKFESKSQQKLFFAKCGDGKTKEQKKWCKMAKEFADSTKDFSKLPEKKDETNEDFTFKNYLEKVGSTITGNIAKQVPKSLRPTFEGKLEESIMKMVNKHITPKMTKKDFIKTIMEAEKESPVIEPQIKPDVKPERQIPQTPYQPKHKPAPKAKEKEIEIPVKPDVKPERQTPQTPYQPKHKPAPKAEDIPQWITFDAIGINLK